MLNYNYIKKIKNADISIGFAKEEADDINRPKALRNKKIFLRVLYLSLVSVVVKIGKMQTQIGGDLQRSYRVQDFASPGVIMRERSFIRPQSHHNMHHNQVSYIDGK